MTHSTRNTLTVVSILAVTGAAIGQTCAGPYGYEVIHRMQVTPTSGGMWVGYHAGYAEAYAGSTRGPCRDLDRSFGRGIISGTPGTTAITAQAQPPIITSSACAETRLTVSHLFGEFRAEHSIRGAAFADAARCNSRFKRNARARSTAGGIFIGRGPAGVAVASGLFAFQGEFANTHVVPFKTRASVVVDPIFAQVLDSAGAVLVSHEVGEVRSVVYGSGSTSITYPDGIPVLSNRAADMDLDIVIHPFIAQPGEDGELRISVRGGVFTRNIQTGIFEAHTIHGTPSAFDLVLPMIEINYTIPLPDGAVELQFGSSAGAHQDNHSGELGDGCSLITGPGEGADFAPISAISPGANLYGVPATDTEHALDFFVPSVDANIEQIIVPFYQEGSGLSGPSLSEVRVQIWEGVPGAGGTIVWGNTTTPRQHEILDGHALYRVGSGLGDKLDTTRPIKFVSIDIDGMFVNQGLVYGVEIVMIEAPGMSEPFIPQSPYFNDAVDRAMRYDALSGQWSAIRDPGTNAGACLSMRVLQSETEGCYADCDGDGQLTIFDFLCYQNLFVAGDPASDCDCDGSLTIFDFLCFQNTFIAGCP